MSRQDGQIDIALKHNRYTRFIRKVGNSMNTQTKQRGFSIIEVVLVLAIAGLIFLMVFIALPALQRSQRDSARQQEVGTVISALGTYASSNNGRAPSTAAQISQVVTGNNNGLMESGAAIQVVTTAFTQQRTVTPSLTASITADNVVTLDEIPVFFGYKCGAVNQTSGAVTLDRGAARQAAVLVIQEIGNTGTVYCKNS